MQTTSPKAKIAPCSTGGPSHQENPVTPLAQEQTSGGTESTESGTESAKESPSEEKGKQSQVTASQIVHTKMGENDTKSDKLPCVTTMAHQQSSGGTQRAKEIPVSHSEANNKQTQQSQIHVHNNELNDRLPIDKSGISLSKENEKQTTKQETPDNSLVNKSEINVTTWTRANFDTWLSETCDLSEYCESFRKSSVNGEMIFDLKDDDLVNEIKITKKLQRDRFFQEAKKLKTFYMLSVDNQYNKLYYFLKNNCGNLFTKYTEQMIYRGLDFDVLKNIEQGELESELKKCGIELDLHIDKIVKSTVLYLKGNK